jgi:hypothetical protein
MGGALEGNHPPTEGTFGESPERVQALYSVSSTSCTETSELELMCTFCAWLFTPFFWACKK